MSIEKIFYITKCAAVVFCSFESIAQERYEPTLEDLKAIEATIAEYIPISIESESASTVCIPAQYSLTNIPEFRGLDIIKKEIKIKISPEIRCNVQTSIIRSGDLDTTFENDTVTVDIPFYADVKATGSGFVGSGINEVATAFGVYKFAFMPMKIESGDIEVRLSVSDEWSAATGSEIQVTARTEARKGALEALMGKLKKLESDIETAMFSLQEDTSENDQ